MASVGRPRSTNDIHTLINRMLKKRDVEINGKRIKRLDALIEILWKRVLTSKGSDNAALNFLLSYGFGHPVSGDKISNETSTPKIKKTTEIPEHIATLLNEIDKEVKATDTKETVNSDKLKT